MKWLAIFYISILIAPNSKAQDTSLASPAMRKIFIEPLALVDFISSPSLRVGTELPFGSTLSVSVTIGSYGNILGSIFGNYANGYYLKGGIRKYWPTGKRHKQFLGVSIFYKKETMFIYDNVVNESGAPINSEPVDYTIRKHDLGINVEKGYVGYWRNWVYEWFIGAGIRVKTASPSISDSLLGTTYLVTGDVSYGVTYARAYNAYWPSLAFGVRAGYMFRRKKG